MKTIYGIIAHTLFALTLVFSQTAAASAENPEKNAEISEAVKLYSQALPLEMDSPKKAELLDQSAAILKKVIANNPKSLEAHRKLMGVYVLKQDYSNGIRTMQDAITLSPEDPKLFISLAFLYEHSGALEYAMAMLDQALTLDPKQQLAMEYKVAIQKKIDALNMEDAHNGKSVMGANHGQLAEETAPPPTDAKP
ncbi:MAG: cytochrome C biogenesis protein [endosymbiont of Seepiophila jonesi]|uniref:Cytochrome C biogenesis protein n=1 Tax=endosymbiont of Lamellibrachia luymesi TaxID=2200907 RepID=A0A370E017_9GAMM|nr:MAG: cytochrome C biogenesis protein [endosymbiont of Seepiophila jonesi]RDH92563.1 MAG: cytochrome C biogenesis protein [endosymbiont of Lamellibrachia luymesi]